MSLDEDTALAEVATGRFAGTISERWFVERGPNGGLLAQSRQLALLRER